MQSAHAMWNKVTCIFHVSHTCIRGAAEVEQPPAFFWVQTRSFLDATHNLLYRISQDLCSLVVVQKLDLQVKTTDFMSWMTDARSFSQVQIREINKSTDFQKELICCQTHRGQESSSSNIKYLSTVNDALHCDVMELLQYTLNCIIVKQPVQILHVFLHREVLIRQSEGLRGTL